MAVALPLAWMPSGGEWLVIALFGLLLFGKRLPDVGRTLGKGIIGFKKGLKGVEEEVTRREIEDEDSPEFDSRLLARIVAVLAVLVAAVCIMAAMEECSRRGATPQAVVLLGGGLMAAMAVAWTMRH